MAPMSLITLIIGTFIVAFSQSTTGMKYTNLTRERWGGTVALFAVSREKVAAKLNEINSHKSCGDVLSLPKRPVFSEFLREDQHVVGVSIGNLRASSFIDTLPTCVADQYTLKAPTVQVYIPMLTGPDPDGPPQYKLVVNSYVSTQKPLIQSNVAVPTTQVEQLVFNERGLSIKDGDEYLNITWKESDICQSFNSAPLNDLEEFTDELMLPYNYQLNFSACDGVGVQDVDLCKTYEKLSCVLSRNKYNACEYWTILGPFKNCKLEAFSLNAVSPEFKASTLLSEESGLPFIAVIQTDVDFQVNLKVPCIEE